jgi:hypothetical protein
MWGQNAHRLIAVRRSERDLHQHQRGDEQRHCAERQAIFHLAAADDNRSSSPSRASKMRAAVVAQTTERDHLLVLASDNQTAKPSVRTTTGIAATLCASDNPLILATG